MCCFCNRGVQLKKADCDNYFDYEQNYRAISKYQECNRYQNGWGKECSHKNENWPGSDCCHRCPKNDNKDRGDYIRVKFDGIIKFC